MTFLETIKEKTFEYDQYEALEYEYDFRKEEAETEGEDFPTYEEWDADGDTSYWLYQDALDSFTYFLQEDVFKGYDWFLYSYDDHLDQLAFIDINDKGSIEEFVKYLNWHLTDYTDDFRFYGSDVVCAGHYDLSKDIDNIELLDVLQKVAIDDICPYFYGEERPSDIGKGYTFRDYFCEELDSHFSEFPDYADIVEEFLPDNVLEHLGAFDFYSAKLYDCSLYDFDAQELDLTIKKEDFSQEVQDLAYCLACYWLDRRDDKYNAITHKYWEIEKEKLRKELRKELAQTA